MQRKLFKELWSLRFQKMLDLEEESVKEYQRILKACGTAKVSDDVKGKLKQLVEDETRHAKYVRELIKILDRQEV